MDFYDSLQAKDCLIKTEYCQSIASVMDNVNTWTHTQTYMHTHTKQDTGATEVLH